MATYFKCIFDHIFVVKNKNSATTLLIDVTTVILKFLYLNLHSTSPLITYLPCQPEKAQHDCESLVSAKNTCSVIAACFSAYKVANVHFR